MPAAVPELALAAPDTLTVDVAPAAAPAPAVPQSSWQYYRDRYDADADGRVTRAEYTRSEDAFVNLDSNRDGVVSKPDFAKRWSSRTRRGGKTGGFFIDDAPRVGELAPDFELSATTGELFRLSGFRGIKPVVLVFGSYT